MTMTDLAVGSFLDEVATSSPAPGGGSVSALAAALAAALVSMVGSLTLRKLPTATFAGRPDASRGRLAVDAGQGGQGGGGPESDGRVVPPQPGHAGAVGDGAGAVETCGAAGQQSAEPEADVEADMAMAVDIASDLRRHFSRLIDEDAEAFRAVMAAYKLPKSTDEERRVRGAAIQEALKQACRVPAQVAKGAVEVLQLSDLVAREGVRSALSDAAVACLLAEAALHGACLNVKINLKSIKDAAFVSEMQGEMARAMSSGRAVRERVMAFVQEELG